MSEILSGYEAVNARVGVLDRSERKRLRVTGPERAKFLHNLTTNEVKRLPAGQGREAFVTSPQGKTLGFVSLLACEDEILLRTDAGGLEHVLPHLQKYGVFDEIGLDDATDSTFELHLAGPEAENLLRRVGGEPPAFDDLSHRQTSVGGVAIRLVRESPTGRPGVTLIGALEDATTVASRIEAEGAALGLERISPMAFETLRIEAGTPVFGREVTTDNLPQEVGREDRAISFVKGCYLGQETVARIDALGHVNRLLKGLRLPGESPPAPGTSLESADGKKVGVTTSSAFSPGWRAPVALAYIRVSHAAPGTELRLQGPDAAVTAIVCDLPMMTPARV